MSLQKVKCTEKGAIIHDVGQPTIRLLRRHRNKDDAQIFQLWNDHNIWFQLWIEHQIGVSIASNMSEAEIALTNVTKSGEQAADDPRVGKY